jgi:hypothetical protein
MELKAFIATKVNPGEPLTAQAWNDLVEAIDAAYKFLQATMHVVRVKVTSSVAFDELSVRVLATRAGASPYQAVPPVPPAQEHVLSGLDPGTYTLIALAAGFAPASSTLTLADAGDTSLELVLTPLGPAMPELFGTPLSDALQALASAGIPVTSLLDFNGRELSANNPGAENASAPVLAQFPSAGTIVLQGASAKLAVALPIAIEPAVEVPSLSGLTLDEAQRALEGMGLVLGRTDNRQRNI